MIWVRKKVDASNMIVELQSLCFMLAIHFVADFPFQGEFLANNKGKSWEILFYHCAVYTGAFLLFGKVSLVCALVLFVSHFIIDTLKARYKVVKFIWHDQIMHFAIICFCLAFNI